MVFLYCEVSRIKIALEVNCIGIVRLKHKHIFKIKSVLEICIGWWTIGVIVLFYLTRNHVALREYPVNKIIGILI